ncbi:MAG: hypothetical protein Q9207_002606 [Kuettlingeria erythrocarpa]
MARRNDYGGVQKNGPPHNGYDARRPAQDQFIVVKAPSGDTAGAGKQNRGQGKGKGNRGRGGAPPPNTRVVQAQIDKQHQLQQRREPNTSRKKPVSFVVKGLLESSAAGDNDKGLERCCKWLADHGRDRLKRPEDYVYVKNPRWQDRDVVFEVAGNDAWWFREADGRHFLDVTLSVQQADPQTRETRQPAQNPAAPAITHAQRDNLYRDVLNERYNQNDKFLRLESLHENLILQLAGSWDPNATQLGDTGVFPALMRVIGESFPSAVEREGWVDAVSIANNRLTSFKPVFELARTFPGLRRLDISNNNIKDLKSLDSIRYRFRHLDILIISPNPIDLEDPEYMDVIKIWFPTLRKLNSDRVRSDEAAASAAPQSASNTNLPLATIKDSSQGIVESMVEEPIPGTDTDRPALARSFHDKGPTFSTSYNPTAPRFDTAEAVSSEPHLKQSPNLRKVFELEPRIQELAAGIEEISNALKVAPPPRNPDLVNGTPKHSFNCVPIPKVPDPYNQLEPGVGGFKVDVSGSFGEYHRNTGAPNAIRSFERSFTLGPGRGETQLRIVSDTLTLRAEGGYEVFNPEAKCMPELPIVTKNFGFSPNPREGEKVEQAFLVGQISKATGLTREFAEQLLVVSDWTLRTAMENFVKAKVSDWG